MHRPAIRPAGGPLYEEHFELADPDGWPAPWVALNAHVLAASTAGGRGHLQGATFQVARMGLPGFAAVDVEITATVTFDDPTVQGFGFYARQNGGALQDTMPHGRGYAVFLEGYGNDHLDATPELQHTAGSIAADLFNYQGIGGLSIDDVVITSP